MTQAEFAQDLDDAREALADGRYADALDIVKGLEEELTLMRIDDRERAVLKQRAGYLRDIAELRAGPAQLFDAPPSRRKSRASR